MGGVVTPPVSTTVRLVEQVRGVEVSMDVTEIGPVAAFWCRLLGYRTDVDLEPDTDWVRLDPPDDLPILNLQRVPEAKRTKNRLHLDIYVDDPEDWIGRALDLGAERLEMHDDAYDWFCVLADPAGNEFCICREPNDE